MHPNTEQFIEQFNRLESALKRKMNRSNSTSFSALVGEASKKDPFIRRYRDLLDSFRELRNVLVHEEGNRIIATPTDGAVTALIKLTDIYTKPEKIYSLFRKKVIIVQGDKSLMDAMNLMKENGFTNLPVYDSEGCIGLLSARVITKWLLDHYDEFGVVTRNVDQVSIQEVLDEIEHIDEVAMVSRHLDVLAFLELQKNRPSPSGFYVITENGKRKEKPLGIISGKDLPELFDYVVVD